MKNRRVIIGVSVVLTLIITIVASNFMLTDFVTEQSQESPELEATRLEGVMGYSDFPVTWFGISPSKGDTREYIVRDVLTLLDGNSDTYYLHLGGRSEMLMTGSRGNSVINGVTFDEINDAYNLGLGVMVKGYSYNESREGEVYKVFHVTDFTVQEPEKLPLIISPFTIETGQYSTINVGSMDRVYGVQRFSVGRNHTGVIWKQVTKGFHLDLREGERISISLNSSRPVSYKIYAPNGTISGSNSTQWGDLAYHKTDTMGSEVNFECHEKGRHTIIIEAEMNVWAEVDLEFTKLRLDTREVYFRERGSHSGKMGGMGSMGLYPKLPPEVITLGRTWSQYGVWTDHSYEFTTRFIKGEQIRYGYNATFPVNMRLKGPENYTVTSYGLNTEGTFTVPSTGDYTFHFDADDRQTALMSFRCNRLIESLFIIDSESPLVVFSKPDTPREPSWIPKYSPTIVTGKLDTVNFPLRWRERFEDPKIVNHDVLRIATDGGESGGYVLHLGGVPDSVPYPEGGNTLITDFSLDDLVNAHDGNLTVALTGFPFQLSRNGTEHEMFHVTGVSVKDSHRLPVVTSHSVTLVSGSRSFSWGNGEVKPFPVEIETGMRTIEEHSGFQEHTFNVYLKEGETIKVTVNSTKGIDFSFNTGHGYRGFGGDYDDYIALEFNVVEINLNYKVEKTGTYYFGIRGYAGASGKVIFDCIRLP